jgi:hypothetical protein
MSRIVALVVAVVLVATMVIAQPPHPSVELQTSYGVITSVNDYGALEEREAITAIDPKQRLYRSDQSTYRDAQGLYAVRVTWKSHSIDHGDGEIVLIPKAFG